MLTAIALVIVGAPGAEAQRADRVPRIGYLVLSPLVDPPSAERAAFLDGLKELGYVAGRNIIVEYRSAAWNRELLRELAAELVDLKVDVIVAVPGAIDAARRRRRRSPSSSRRSPIRSKKESSRALGGRAAISPGPAGRREG